MKLITLLLFSIIALTSWSQTIISGVVMYESGEPIPGANIIIKDSYDETGSAIDGTCLFTTSYHLPEHGRC